MNRQPHVCKECYKFLELSNYNANRKIKVTYIEKFKRDFKITRCCFRDITRILIPHVIERRSSSGRLIYTYMHIHRPKHKVGILIIIMCYHVLSHAYSKLPRKDTPSKHNYSLNPAPKKEQRFDREHNKIVTWSLLLRTPLDEIFATVCLIWVCACSFRAVYVEFSSFVSC